MWRKFGDIQGIYVMNRYQKGFVPIHGMSLYFVSDIVSKTSDVVFPKCSMRWIATGTTNSYLLR
jgi:hypothetical protein